MTAAASTPDDILPFSPHILPPKKIKIKKQNQGTSEVVGKKYKEMKEISVIIVIT